jgi:DUF1680 family protein
MTKYFKKRIIVKDVLKGIILTMATMMLFIVTSAQVKDVFTPLPPGAVQLNGFLQNDIKNSVTHWNMGVVPYRAFVDIFRNGRTFFAEGEMWGKAVRSGCMFYRYTHNPELKKILQKTVADLLTTRRSNGSISASPVSKQPDGPGGDLWERTYVLLGLERYYTLVDEDPKVLKAMIDEADCTLQQIGPPPKVNILDQGWSPNHIESNTILDPIMRLYKITGYKRYIDFAKYIVNQGGAKGYNLIKQAYNNVPPYKMGGTYPKAYEMMSLFDGLIEYYRVTGDQYIKQAVLNLFHNIQKDEITIIGNGGGDQPYHPDVYGEAWDNTHFEQTNPNIKRMMETCAGVTWTQFCTQVLKLTGDPSTSDYMEKYIYNGLIGAMKPDGMGFSYVNLLDGIKTNIHGWGGKFGNLTVTCCNLNGPMGLAYIPLIAVMNSKDGLVVNLYNAGEVTAKIRKEGNVKLDIKTDYPRTGNIAIDVNPNHSEEFTIKLRIPSWSRATTLKVNGMSLKVKPGTYKNIRRKWSQGDQIHLHLDMRCRLIHAPHGSNPAAYSFVALVRGPVVLARDQNIDSNYNKPVSIISKKGYVNVIPETPTLPGTRMQFRVRTTNGYIHVEDYASVNNWNGTHICSWLPTKNN